MPKVTEVLAEDKDGNKVWMTPAQVEALDILEQANRGGCAAVTGYKPTTNYVKSPTKNIQMLTRFDYHSLLRRKLTALQSITFKDVQPNIKPDSKLGQLSEAQQVEWFTKRLAQEVASINKSLSGDRSDAHRQGHDRCYARFAEGVKVHLHTETVNGIKEPVLFNGYPKVKSVMVSFLELNSKTIVEGERKVVNSGPSVLMKNAINKVLNQRSVGIRTLSLNENNFEKLSIHNDVVLPQMVAEAVA